MFALINEHHAYGKAATSELIMMSQINKRRT